MAFKRLQEQAYNHLHGMVLDGCFEQGIIYSETKLAESLGISRTPTRDALQKLSHEGLIDIMPSKGFRLHVLTPQDARDIQQMRCAVEGYCVQLMAERSDEPELRRSVAVLRSILEQQREVLDSDGDTKLFAAHDFRFHMHIVNFPGNDVFTDTYRNQMHRLGIAARTALSKPDRMALSWAEHGTLVDAIASGNSAAAYDALITHYRSLVQLFSASCPVTRQAGIQEGIRS